MAEALIAGILGGGAVTPESVLVTEKHPERAEYLRERYGVTTLTAEQLAERADIIVFAVKPQVIDEVLADLAGRLHDEVLLVSVAAGIPTSRFERDFPALPVVRVMPNTPALVGEGMSVIAAGTTAKHHHLGYARAILATAGKVLELSEDLMDAVTAVSGTGPAYFFYLTEALVDAAVEVGLDRDVAARLVVQTAVGAATMLRDSGREPVELRRAVTSPGGTTAAGIGVLEERGTREIVAAAVRAARDRSAELGSGA
jgi:pyrroline-5-carboxylate reductase